jgi:hypothetical protein
VLRALEELTFLWRSQGAVEKKTPFQRSRVALEKLRCPVEAGSFPPRSLRPGESGVVLEKPRAVWRNRSGLEKAILPGEARGMPEKALRSAAIEIVLEKLSHSGETERVWGRFAALETLTLF